MPAISASPRHLPPSQTKRIFGYSVPAFLLVMLVTLLCGIVPRLTARFSPATQTSHAPVPSRTAEQWMHSLRGP